MEAYALFQNAANLGAAALAITTISDSLITGAQLSPEERQHSFAHIMQIALGLL
jgi:purine-nucleoside phosphorylase